MFVAFQVESESWTDEERYTDAMSFASRYLSWTQLKLLKMSLALRSYSPRIEMFQQIAKDRGVDDKIDDCEFVLDFKVA